MSDTTTSFDTAWLSGEDSVANEAPTTTSFDTAGLSRRRTTLRDGAIKAGKTALAKSGLRF